MTVQRLLVAGVAVVVLAGCDNSSRDTRITRDSSSTTTSITSRTDATAAEAAVAMWPSADTTFSTPEAAAEDFVSRVFDVPPMLGGFRQGDTRSGEIDVLAPPNSTRGRSSTPVVRSTLVLRQLGARNGWFVIAASTKYVTIANLSTGDRVRLGRVEVQGQARGFEGNVVVRAYTVGDDVELSKSVVQAGSTGEPAAYRTTIDVSGVDPGSAVFIVVRGGTGLDRDPGEFAAIPVVVG